MPSRSRSARRSSISAGGTSRRLLVVATVGCAVVGAVGCALNHAALAGAGSSSATAFAGAFAVDLIVQERRRHESPRTSSRRRRASSSRWWIRSQPCPARTSRTRSSSGLRRGAATLRRPGAVRLTGRGGRRRPDGKRVCRSQSAASRSPSLVLSAPSRFAAGMSTRASVLADFASHAVENARLVVEAQEREAERGCV